MPGESWNVNYYLLSIGKVLSLQYKVMVWVIFLLPTHAKTLYVLKFNLCVWMNVDAFIDHCPNFIIRWLLSPFQRPLPPFWLHFMLHQCKLPAILHAFLCCLLLSLVRFPWNNLRINFLCHPSFHLPDTLPTFSVHLKRSVFLEDSAASYPVPTSHFSKPWWLSVWDPTSLYDIIILFSFPVLSSNLYSLP